MGLFACMDKKISIFVQKYICCNQLYSMKHKICEILKYLEISVKKIPCFHLYLFKINEKNLGHWHFVGFSLYLFPHFVIFLLLIYKRFFTLEPSTKNQELSTLCGKH